MLVGGDQNSGKHTYLILERSLISLTINILFLDNLKIKHVNLKLNVNFKRKLVRGSAVFTMMKFSGDMDSVILNSKSQRIHNVVDHATGKILKYEKDGDELKVFLSEINSRRMKLRINYEILSGLVWLTPTQTAGKKKPFLFSQGDQGKGYLCVLFPCQHTNLVKTTFSARVLAPAGMAVLMSAVPGKKKKRRKLMIHKFRQDVPIASYLVAMAVGNLKKRSLGERTHVWSEPEILETAATDFSETETMLKTGEDICGPYLWKIYDILVLPPAFAYGGMENPCMTFASPTLVTGDKGNTDVIIHEIAHSWAGNLVTNANKKHFWLNEGLTSFIEGKILAKIHGQAVGDLSGIFLYRKMQKDVDSMFNKTSLVGAGSEDGVNNVPYGKGMALARYLEETVGGPPIFNKFLKAYFRNFAHQSIETKDFKDFFMNYFSQNSAVHSIDWDTWLYKPGMPVVKPRFDYSLEEECEELARYWQEQGVMDMDQEKLKTMFNKMIALQKQEFLEILLEGEALEVETIKQMSELYALDSSPNAEILMRWWRLGIKARYKPSAEQALNKIRNYGRVRIILFLYQDLYNWEEMRQATLDTFSQHKPGLMDAAVRYISKILYPPKEDFSTFRTFKSAFEFEVESVSVNETDPFKVLLTSGTLSYRIFSFLFILSFSSFFLLNSSSI